MPPLVSRRVNFGPRAPIVEALIDLRAPATAEPGVLRALADSMSAEFPHVVGQVQWGLSLKLGGPDATASTTPAAPRGFLLHSADRTRAVQVRRDGFTMSHLRPYGSWDGLVADARSMWPQFVAAAAPASVPRLAVRYINRLVLPRDEPLHHWLNLYPQTPEPLEYEPVEFAMRTVHVHPVYDPAIAVVNVGLEHNAADQPRTVILDIDCFVEGISLDPADPLVWERLDHLRDFKNDIFFASITSNTEALFQ